MKLVKDSTLLEFDTKDEALEFVPEMVKTFPEIPEMVQLEGVINGLKVGDEITRRYSFESKLGPREIELEIILYDDQLDIHFRSDNKLCDKIDKIWWARFPDEEP